MDRNHPFLFKIPQGAEGLFLEEAQRRQSLTSLVQEGFRAWGYGPVQTPALDFYDLYAPLISKPDQMYRLIDRDGELLMLRSDITLFLARHLGLSLSPGHAPLRVSYADSLFRPQDDDDIATHESFQVGAEFVGAASPEGDWEVLLLLDDILERLGLPEARIHIGSRALAEALLPREGLEAALKAITLRDPEGLPPGQAEFFLNVIGSPDQAVPAAEKALAGLNAGPELRALWTDLLETVRLVSSLGRPGRFVLDVSEVGRQPYYTGLVWSAYHPGAGEAIAAGGRYDRLLGRFGLDSPSVGWSLMLRKAEALLGKAQATPALPAAPGRSFAQRLAEARRLRAAGTPCTL